MNSRFDHHLLAADIEALYGLSTRVDHRLHDSGLVSWIDPARRASLQILEQLAALRAELDHIAVAAGLDAMRSPYFPVRSMKPTTETKAAARRAHAEAQDAERQAQMKREADAVRYGRAGWSARSGT